MKRTAMIAAILGALALPAKSLETVGFGLTGGSDALRETLIDSSLVVQAKRDGISDTQEVMAAARSDYARLISVLYDRGFFAPVISIRVDGREAGQISPLETPSRISRVDFRVTTGQRYTFGDLSIAPLAPRTELPNGFRRGEIANTAVIQRAARGAVRSWQDIGHPKADISDQRIVADHRANQLSAALRVAPGPQLRFGTMRVAGETAVRVPRIRKIAGFPTGELVTPDAVEKVTENLRRTGTFRSVILQEAEIPNPDGTLDMELRVTDQLPRRFGFGAEYSTTEGVQLSGLFIHRNLFGGAERLELNGTITGLATDLRDPGLEFTSRLTRPASPRTDTDLFFLANLGILDERDYSGENLELGFGWTRRFSERLTGELGVSANWARIDDDFGESRYAFVAFPLRLTYDKRNDFVAPTNGYYLDTRLRPFLNINGTSNGARFFGDLRFYEDFFEGDRLVLAARLQLGSIVGPDLRNTPNYLLFYSGGGGTVRGQEFESLGVELGGGKRTGGRSFLGAQTEVRGRITDQIELVGFYDWGYIGAESFPDGSGESHSGVGLGVRYVTPIGPLRVDIGTPATGPDSGKSLLLYIGIGQAF